jgi:hypothetical protein
MYLLDALLLLLPMMITMAIMIMLVILLQLLLLLLLLSLLVVMISTMSIIDELENRKALNTPKSESSTIVEGGSTIFSDNQSTSRVGLLASGSYLFYILYTYHRHRLGFLFYNAMAL